MRGLFTAGVLDVLMERGVKFDGLVGVSAGACFGCNYKSGQIGRVIRYNKRFARDPRYCSWKSLFTTGDLFGVEFCYRTLPLELDVFDTAAYEATELPYTDLDLIADYALPAVKTAYALGIIEGKSRLEERFFDPKGTITRQEVMTVIGRTLEEGLGKADISGFSDASDVAGWALPYVQILVCQGVIDGSGGRINPLKGMTRAEAAAVIYRCY